MIQPIVSWAFAQRHQPMRVRAMLVALAWHADEHGVVERRQYDVGRDAGYRDHTTGRAVSELLAAGLLRSAQRIGATSVSRYVLNIEGAI